MLFCISRFFICVLLVVSMFSCNTDKLCNEDRTTFLKIGLYSRRMVKDTLTLKDTTFAGFAFHTVNGSEVTWTDTLSKVHTLKLPLSQLADSSIIALKLGYKTGSFNNYIIKYTRSQVFINYECGFRTDFTIDTLITNNLDVDSIYINSRVVTNVDDEHIKIYMHPAVSDVIKP
jgi:Family of unknown function (DUF6452)